MTLKEKMKELEDAIASANTSLQQTNDPNARQDLTTAIGQKTAQLRELQAANTQQYASVEEELAALRQDKHDREIKETASEIARQIATGVKTAQTAEKERISGLVMSQIREALSSDTGAELGLSVKGLVAEALSDMRGGRRTPLFPPNGAGEVDASSGNGYKGGGTFIRNEPDKGTASEFYIAVGRGDKAAIADMQAANKIVDYAAMGRKMMGRGGKALTEGFGVINATDAVAGPSGGYIVPPDFSRDIIPLLYPFVTMRRAGATVMPMRSPAFLRPRLAAGSTATYRGEAVPIPVSQQTFDQFSLYAKELSALVPISAELVNDSDPSIEGIVKADMSMQIGLKEDFTFLFGTGSVTVPQGILLRSDIPSANVVVGNASTGDDMTSAGAGYTYVIDMLTKLRKANVPRIRQAWFGPPDMIGMLLKVKDGQGRPIFTEYMNPQQSTLQPGSEMFPQPDYTLMGRPFYDSTQFPIVAGGSSGQLATLALVEMSQVVIGQLGEMELAASTEGTFVDINGNTVSAFQSNLVLYRGIMRHDINLLHPAAVVVHTNILVG